MCQFFNALKGARDRFLDGLVGKYGFTGQNLKALFPCHGINILQTGIASSLRRIFIDDTQPFEPHQGVKEPELTDISFRVDFGKHVIQARILGAFDNPRLDGIACRRHNGRDGVPVIGQILSGPSSGGDDQIEIFLL